jgi:hypothetical protein
MDQTSGRSGDLDQSTRERVHDHAFRLQLAERPASPMHMPAWRSNNRTFGAEIVAAQQFLLEELILLGGESAGQALLSGAVIPRPS